MVIIFFTFRGFAKLTDESGSREIFYLAPSIFLGNKRSSYMYYLSFDLSQETINNPIDASNEGDVIIKGRLQTFRLVYKLAIMPAEYQKFQSYQVSSFFFFDGKSPDLTILSLEITRYSPSSRMKIF